MSEEKQPQVRVSRAILVLLGIGMILSLYLIVAATSAYFQDPQSNAWQSPLFFGLLILGTIWVFNLLMKGRAQKVELPTVSQIKCEQEGCAYSEIRDFKEGDYIFKRLGQCPSCGGQNTLYIDLIYAYNPLAVKSQSTQTSQRA